MSFDVPVKCRSVFKLPMDPITKYADPLIVRQSQQKRLPPQSSASSSKNRNSSFSSSANNGVKTGGVKKASQAAIAVFKVNPLSEKAIRQYIQLAYPELLFDCAASADVVDYLLKQVFVPNIKGRYVITNNSYSSPTGTLVTRLSIRSVNSSFLTSHLYEPDRQLRVSGSLTIDGVFLIDRIDIVREAKLMFNERTVEVSVQYNAEPSDGYLRVIAQDVPTYSKEMHDALTLWNRYLDWKRKLSELKIRGVKYIGVRIVEEERGIEGIAFRCVVPDKPSYDQFARTIHRESDSIAVFPNNMSKNRWSFDLNTENKTAREDILPFNKIYERTSFDSLWEEDSAYLQKLKDVPVLSQREYRETIVSMQDAFPNPIFFEILFNIEPADLDAFEKQLWPKQQIYSHIQQKILPKFGRDGFIATSKFGDFTLNTRLKQAVSELSQGRATSGNLGNWIFDITKARERSTAISTSDIQWSCWGAECLNSSQKEAISGMLAAPDVFLCQGPPGTGKTTVIAETVYQLTLRNKRVLIASQTNLAVNNALSRLARYPNIRAIRLGADSKLDESVEDISDKRIIQTFYKRIRDGIDQSTISRWMQLDSERKELHDIEKSLCELSASHERIKSEEKEFLKQRDQVSRRIATLKEQSEREYEQNEALKSQKARLTQYAVALDQHQEIREAPFLDTVQADNLYAAIKTEIEQFTNLGFNLLPKYTDVNQGFSALSRKETNYAIFDIIRWLQFIHSIDCVQDIHGSTKAISTELRELIMQGRELGERTDLSEMEMVQLYKINQRIKQLETDQGIKSIPDDLLQFLPERLRRETVKNDTSDMILSSIKEDVDSIAEIVLAKTASFFWQCVEDISLRIEPESTELQQLYKELHEIQDRLNELSQRLQEDEQRQIVLAARLGCNTGELNETINMRRRAIEKEEQEPFSRADFESFLQEFLFHIDSLGNDYSLENSEYLKHFINACNVVGISCTESSYTLVQNGFNVFDVAIIDEVSKATPPELLIPLLLAEKVILVGDHRQLPPLFDEHWTTYQDYLRDIDANDVEAQELLSEENYRLFEELVTNSLFKHHYEHAAASNKLPLLQQYRMHREIMDVVNMFYDGKLEPGLSEAYETRQKSHTAIIRSHRGSAMLVTQKHHAYWVDSSALRGKNFYEQKPSGTSIQNALEALLIAKMLQQIDDSYSNLDVDFRMEVGVISFYAAQVRLIKKMVNKYCLLKHVSCEINTVDRFQGKEKPIVLVSLVRNVEPGKRYDATYVKAYQRINVAVSRAQNLLLIVGAKEMYADQEIPIEDMNTGRLTESKLVYRDIIELLNMRGCFITADDILNDEEVTQVIASR